MSRLFRALLMMVATLAVGSASAAEFSKKDAKLLTPENSAILFIDHQPQMAFAVQSMDRGLLTNNVTGLAKTAKVFSVPVVLTTVAEKSFSGPIFPEIAAALPGEPIIDRTNMNAWEDKNFKAAVAKTGRKKLVIAGLWTEVCVALPTLSAIAEGYEVYVVTDASGGVSTEAHNASVQRMVQAGAIPVTWIQVMLEYQRDWARSNTYAGVIDIVQQHGGAYGTGVNYAQSFGSH